MDPIEFLRQHEPFARMGSNGLRRVERQLEIEYARAGQILLSRDGEPARRLSVLRKGVVRLEVDGRVVDELVEGEVFGFPSLLARSAPFFDVVCETECLLYQIPGALFHELIEDEPVFGRFFRSGLADRLRSATSGEPAALAGDLALPVEHLMRSPAIFVERDATVGDAARKMREQRVSSVLVRGEPTGILTDRDLRGRVLAEGLGAETPVVEVMTAPVISVDAGAPLIEVLMQFLGGRLHHLPVRNENEIVGLVNHTDLLRHQSRSPSFLLRKILRGQGRQEGGAHVREVAQMIDGLGWGGLGATDVARVVAAVNDALVERLLRDGEQELGSPPCSYSWIVFGSEGRREQLLATDQDNALIYSETCENGKEYFERLARFVVGGLIDAGFPECKGGFMATNWCYSLDHWIRTFRGWIAEPEPEALMEVANFFDFRPIHGGLDLSALEQTITEGGRNATFLAQLARASLAMRPPFGLFNRLKQSEEGLNIKAAGLMPVVGLARVYGLESGTHERSTLGRLRAARDKGALSADGADLLEEGFRFLLQLRLQVQIEAVRRGEPPGNFVRLESLGRLEARHLKETLLEIRTMQQALAQRHRVELLG